MSDQKTSTPPNVPGMAAFLRANADRYRQIEHLRERVEPAGSSYGRTSYRVVLDSASHGLSDNDLIVLCDQGNACFGGRVERGATHAIVDVFTD